MIQHRNNLRQVLYLRRRQLALRSGPGNEDVHSVSIVAFSNEQFLLLKVAHEVTCRIFATASSAFACCGVIAVILLCTSVGIVSLEAILYMFGEVIHATYHPL